MLIVEGIAGKCFSANMLWDGHRPYVLSGKGHVRCRFQGIPLLPQSYTVKMAMRGSDGRLGIVPLQEVASFEVAARLEDYGLGGEFYAAAARSVSVVVPYEWRLPGGESRQVELRPRAVMAGV